MNLYENLIANHNGAGWNSNEATNVYVEDEYTFFEIVDLNKKTEISFRNVGELNTDAAIQFYVTEYTFRTNRKKSISFSIPLSLADLFIQRLNTLKTQP